MSLACLLDEKQWSREASMDQIRKDSYPMAFENDSRRISWRHLLQKLRPGKVQTLKAAIVTIIWHIHGLILLVESAFSERYGVDI
jgi:hypothetical protein